MFVSEFTIMPICEPVAFDGENNKQKKIIIYNKNACLQSLKALKQIKFI